MGSSLIQDQNRRVLQNGACQRQPLPFTSAQQTTIFPIIVLYPKRQTGDERMNVCLAAKRLQFPRHRHLPWPVVIVADGAVEEMRLLRDDGHHLPHILSPIIPQLSTIQPDMTRIIIPETHQQIDDGRFACTAGTDWYTHIPWGNVQAQITQDKRG